MRLSPQVQFLEDERTVLAEEAAATKAALEADRARLAEAKRDSAQLRSAVLDAQRQADQLIGALQALAAEKDNAIAAQAAAANEVSP